MVDENTKNQTILNFFDGFYDFDIERPRTLKKALLNFESVVKNIKKVTELFRSSNFDIPECTTILDAYYSGEMGNLAITPRQDENYYYVLTMPQLLDIEFALETLEIKSGEIRQKVDKLKRELWQLLPDFYKGHINPMPQPLTYNPGKPYPYSCTEGSLLEARRHKLWQWGLALENIEEYSQYMPDDDTAPTTISFHKGDVTIDDKSAPTDIHWTEMYPFDNMLSFAEDVINNHDPTYLAVDPEGHEVSFYTTKARSRNNVKLVVYWGLPNKDEEDRVIILSAILSRRQVARCFIAECEKAIRRHTHPDNTERDYVHEWRQGVKRLKGIL